MYGKILVPLDGSPIAEKVLSLARFLATGLKVPVELLSVIDLAELARNVSPNDNRLLDTLAEDETRARRDYLSTVAATFTEARWRVERGKAESVIIESAAGAPDTLIAMATHGRSGLNRWLLGSVAEKVLRGASNPLLLVRAPAAAVREQSALASIVVPLDGSELAETVLPTVVDLAKKIDLEVTLLRAFHLPYGIYDGGGYGADLENLFAAVEAEAKRYLEEKRAALQAAGLTRVAIAARQGLSADEIIKFSGKSAGALIAMSSHGRSGVQRWVLGSVAETVVRHADNPMLIVRAAA